MSEECRPTGWVKAGEKDGVTLYVKEERRSTYDYRALLMRYMNHIAYEEGSTHLGGWFEYGFTPEEWAELQRLDKEAAARQDEWKAARIAARDA